jgi:putative (di)nucleoside polyphosphate hydrolase
VVFGNHGETGDKEDMTPAKEVSERTEYFRASVGAMLVNKAGKVLVLQRADVAGEAWQMPQGGVRRGEDLQQALQRELLEEIGILPEHFKLIAVCTEWLAYELPEAYRNEKVGRGQIQKWFLCRFQGEPDAIKPDGIEFVAYKWVQQSRLLDLADPFRRPIYERLLSEFAPHLKQAPG